MVGMYHPFSANRKALIKRLSSGVDLEFEEIDDWKHIGKINSEVIVIFSPEFLPNDISTKDFKNSLEGLNKTVVIVAHDISTWEMNRNRIFYLEDPDKEETIDKINKILIMETNGHPLITKR